MSMDRATAEKAVVASAIVVFATYFYRHLTEGTTPINNGAAQMVGQGTPPNFGRFLTGWGFAYFVIALITEASPGFGGAFAILVATGDFIVNAQQVAQDINAALVRPPATPAKTSNTPTSTGSNPAPTKGAAASVTSSSGVGLTNTPTKVSGPIK